MRGLRGVSAESVESVFDLGLELNKEEVMAKVAEDAALELELDDERIEVKMPRHIRVAVNHLQKQQEKAQARFDQAKAELDTIKAMIELAGRG